MNLPNFTWGQWLGGGLVIGLGAHYAPVGTVACAILVAGWLIAQAVKGKDKP